MVETTQQQLGETPQEPQTANRKKPSACKLKDMPFDQRTLEDWVH